MIVEHLGSAEVTTRAADRRTTANNRRAPIQSLLANSKAFSFERGPHLQRAPHSAAHSSREWWARPAAREVASALPRCSTIIVEHLEREGATIRAAVRIRHQDNLIRHHWLEASGQSARLQPVAFPGPLVPWRQPFLCEPDPGLGQVTPHP